MNRRRTFVQALLGTGLASSIGAFLYPVLRYLLPVEETGQGGDSVVAAKVAEMKLNSARIFKFGSRPGMLIRTSEGGWKAFSAVCTHLNCTVQYRGETQQIWCACHNGLYDLNGKNVSGPPPRPLEEYQVNLRGEEIIVSKKT